jgi:Secretion system C-terminal sorting domain
MGPMMQKFGDEFGSKFKNFGDNFNFETAGSKTIKELNAFPNKPNNNKLNVKFEAPEKGDVTIRVTDLAGKEIGIEKLQDFSGEYIGQVDLKGNAKGTIFVTVVQGEDGSTRRVVLN